MKAKDKVYDAAESIRPYVERAMADEKLRDDVMRAYGTAREIYQDLMGEKSAITLASRVATDDDIRDKVRDAIEDLRNASDRIQGKKEHTGRNATLLVAGIALGLLFNPITGPETRRFIKDMLSSGDDPSHGAGGSNGRTQSSA
jgi:gas vesicle protein